MNQRRKLPPDAEARFWSCFDCLHFPRAEMVQMVRDGLTLSFDSPGQNYERVVIYAPINLGRGFLSFRCANPENPARSALQDWLRRSEFKVELHPDRWGGGEEICPFPAHFYLRIARPSAHEKLEIGLRMQELWRQNDWPAEMLSKICASG